MVSSEQARTYIYAGLAILFFFLAIWLGIKWLTGQEMHRYEFFMILGALGVSVSLLWRRYAPRPPR